MAIDPAEKTDLPLPDDLQFLAEQLSEDADHLSRTFPASAPHSWKRAFGAALAQKVYPVRGASRNLLVDHRGSSLTWLGGSVAAAAVAMVALGWYSLDHPMPRDTHEREAGVADVPDAYIPAGVLPSFGSPPKLPSTRHSTIVGPVGAESFDRYLTGPEQEAMIDFMHENQIREPSVRY